MSNTERTFKKNDLQVVIIDNHFYRFEKLVNGKLVQISSGNLPLPPLAATNDPLFQFVTLYGEEHGPELRNLLTRKQ